MNLRDDPHRRGRHAVKGYALGNPDQDPGRHRVSDDDDRAAGAGCALGAAMVFVLGLAGAPAWLWPWG